MPSTSVPRYTNFVTFPEYFVYWPIILLGIVLPLLQDGNPEAFSEQTAALIWGCTLVFVCLSCGLDFGRSTAMMIVLTLIAGFFGTMWYGSHYNVEVIQEVSKWIKSLDLRISRDLQHLISVGLFCGYAWMFLDVFFSSRRFQATFHQIERTRLFRGPEYYKNSREQPARALLDDVMDYVLSFGGVRVYAFNATTGRMECLGIAVGWGSGLDERLDHYAEATPTHEVT